jgi:hypothetical protein
LRIGIDTDILRSGIDLEGVQLAGILQCLDHRVEGGRHTVVDFDVAHRRR